MKKLLIGLLLSLLLPLGVEAQTNNYNVLDKTTNTITGGTVDGSCVGCTTPAAGHFTTLSATTPAQFDSSTKVATTASVVQQSGNYSGVRTLATSTSLANSDSGSNIIFTASGQTLTLNSVAAAAQAVTVSAIFTSGTLTVNVSGGALIYGPTGVGATTFVINAGETVQFTVDAGLVWVVNSYVSVVGAYATVLQHSAQEVDKSYTFSTPTTGTTVTIASGTETALIVPAGTLAALTVTLPGCTSGYDGSLVSFSSTQVITALTVNATSGSVADAPSTLALGAGHKYLCRGSTTTWYQLY